LPPTSVAGTLGNASRLSVRSETEMTKQPVDEAWLVC
jgi:hypothetical protein